MCLFTTTALDALNYVRVRLLWYDEDFTGISAPYEEPESPEIHIKTSELSVDESVRVIVEYLVSKGYIQ